MDQRRRIAYVIDPRLPGGTSSAVAQELRVMHPQYDLSVHTIKSDMFKGDTVAPQLAAVLDELGIEPVWDAREIAADTVILHNPSFLKFQAEFTPRIIAHDLIVVTHENFTRPGGSEGFDVLKCLGLLNGSSLALRKLIAPVSPLNRRSVTDWLTRHPSPGWTVSRKDWFNICDFALQSPNPEPRDRRGRLSRAGYEKFPPLDVMDLCFPATAKANVILGADTFIADEIDRPHWDLLRFRQIELDQFMERIDFMVYFTAPTWRESFGRVLAEATAAGKLVITDASTAENFGEGLIVATPREVDEVIAGLIADPARYCAHVHAAQSGLSRLSPEAFLSMVTKTLRNPMGAA